MTPERDFLRSRSPSVVSERGRDQSPTPASTPDVERELGTLAGIPFFPLDESPPMGLEEAEPRIAAAFQEERSEASTARLRNAFRTIQEGIDGVQLEVAKLAAAIDAFEAVNLRAIAEWGTPASTLRPFALSSRHRAPAPERR